VSAIHDAVEAEVVAHEDAGALEEIDIAAAHQRAYTRLGLSLPADLLDEVMGIEQRAWWEGMTVAADVPEVLRTLRRAGLRLGLCSNAPYRGQSLRDQIAHLGLGALLDSVTLSCEVGWRKPSARIFERALADLGARTATTVMVGDTVAADIVGAHGLGMRAILLREHRADPDPERLADAAVDRIAELPHLLGAG
jgi:putative hydrolase of the HAD superfamily